MLDKAQALLLYCKSQINKGYKMAKEKKKDLEKLKLIGLVNLVWIIVVSIGIGSYWYGQNQFNKGVNYGIEQTKHILVK